MYIYFLVACKGYCLQIQYKAHAGQAPNPANTLVRPGLFVINNRPECH